MDERLQWVDRRSEFGAGVMGPWGRFDRECGGVGGQFGGRGGA